MERSFIVSFSFNMDDPSKSVCVVGEKQMNQAMEIINAFQGSDADDIFRKLTTKKEVPENAGD